MSDYEELMKRCRAGTTNHDDANGLHADCYGAIGRLLWSLRKIKKWMERGGTCGLCYASLDRCEPHKEDCILAEIGGEDG